MLNHPDIARQLAQQGQREMVAQASQWRLRRQLRTQAAQPRAASPADRQCWNWQTRAQATLRALVHRLVIRRPAT